MSEQVTNEQDLYALDLNELKRLALEESSQQEQTQEVTEQSRDEQGRFTKAEAVEDQQVADEDEQPQEKATRFVVRRVVDIGEGVDPEIFEAEGATKDEALELLADKIADSKRHATRKIREQEAQLRKVKENEAPKARQFSEDEEYVYSQELMAKPTEAFAKMFREMTGVEITQFKTVADKVNAFEAGRQANEAIANFLTTHPDYEDNKRSADLMTLALEGRDKTAENLEKAYQSLVSKGLFVTGDGQASLVQDETEQPKTGITSKTVKTPPQGTKKASGLPTTNRSAVPVKSNEPSMDELYNMPLEKLRDEANKRMSGR
jgi:hypothetical protein